MRTPKIEALHRLINWYNERYNTKIPLIGLDETLYSLIVGSQVC